MYTDLYTVDHLNKNVKNHKYPQIINEAVTISSFFQEAHNTFNYLFTLELFIKF